MGVVFLAHDTTLHRQVALKVLGSPGDGETARVQLLREARNAAALNHPNICTVYEVGEADGRAFIAMEYVDGQALSDRLAGTGLPLREVVRYGIEAADALEHAHEHGVIHRDLKAANAIVTTTGRLKLVDFGLARREDALLVDATTMASLAPAGVTVGTPYAMAPEQVRGGVTDARTDIWALGVLLYEMVSGSKPFGALTIPELFSSILRDAPAPLPNGVPVDVQSVIERCLEKEPERRYHRADEVRTALEAIQAGTTPMWATWRARVRRRPWVAAAAAGIALITLLVGANVGGVRDRFSGSPAAVEPIKLAVLPFENLTGDPEQEYFSDGLTEEMITQLGRLDPQRLSVIARTSSMRYKKRDVPVDQIGRELGVDYVMEGSARREGNRVRISATLIRVRDQTQHWTDSFDRELASILVLQGDVARGVAGSLALTLLPDEQSRVANARPVNPEAYEAYLKGHFHAQKETPADLDVALKYFETALQKDPDYAPAHTGIAFVWTARNQMGYVPPSEATPRVKAAAMKAIELDPTLALAHYALGMAAWNEWNWEANEREFRRALELDPNLADVRAFYSHLLIALKRPDEALAQIERAVQLDPFNAFIRALYGVDLYFVRRYDEAIVQLQSALKTSPDLPFAHCVLGKAFNMKGIPEQALVAAEGCLGHYSPEIKDALARGYSDAGYRGAMRRVADLLATGVTGAYVAPIDVFSAYLHAGQKDAALEWLSKAVEAGDPNVYGPVRDPFTNDSLRDDPRFQDLLRRTRLPI
jgi:TolB-like protein/tetratricopeptide (TPR) repeat protein/predicted Ser/Thr protein kinase